MLQVGDRMPAATLFEYIEEATDACPIGPNPVAVPDALQGKTVLIVTVPGAFTPTCSERHVPGYLAAGDQLAQAGIDEVWCISVNDAFVMGAWGRSLGTQGKVRMLGDGSATWTRAAGLEFDLSARGLGLRCQRSSAVVVDGVVKLLRVEAPGKFEVSDVESTLAAWQAAR